MPPTHAGYLITLMYPVDPHRDANDGPPFPVSPDLYRGLLQPAGFECTHVALIDPAQSPPERKGREYLGLWRRK